MWFVLISARKGNNRVRYLLVIFAKKSDARLRIVTARDMTETEKKQVKRRRKQMAKLSKFESDEALITWFEENDTAPYMDDMEESDEEFKVIRTIFVTKPLDVRWRADYLTAIQTLAERKGVPYHRLIQSWLLEKLRQEAPDLVP
jgi:predicted DNA binding CopG/RHH family protein